MIYLLNPANIEKTTLCWNWATLIGPDSQDFLHRLTTIHVKSLKPGRGARGCFLSPQGKIRSYFTLWNYRPDQYAFEFDAGSSNKWAESLYSLIDQFTFGEKITFTPSTTLMSYRWLFPQETELLKPFETIIKNIESKEVVTSSLEPDPLRPEIRICHHGSDDFGRPWLTAWGQPTLLDLWIKQEFSEVAQIPFSDTESWRVQALRPRTDAEITDSVLPLEVGLHDAIASNKGCYPGQEVIEKIIALGAPPRRLVQVEGVGKPPHAGDKILNLTDPPTEMGQVTSALSSSPQKYLALGLVRKIYAKEGLKVQFSNEEKSVGTLIKVAPYG